MNIDGQMNIYDFLDPENLSEDNLPKLEEAARKITEKFQIDLKPVFDGYTKRIEYRGKVKTKDGKATIVIHEGFYTSNGKRFIGVDIDWSMSGIGRPCDNLKEILKIFERYLKNE